MPDGGAHGRAALHVNLPMPVQLERVGRLDRARSRSFTTALTPHWNVTRRARRACSCARPTPRAATRARRRPAARRRTSSTWRRRRASRATTTSSSTTARRDEEYVQIQCVDGNRLWFSSPSRPATRPALRAAHTRRGDGARGHPDGARRAASTTRSTRPPGTITEVARVRRRQRGDRQLHDRLRAARDLPARAQRLARTSARRPASGPGKPHRRRHLHARRLERRSR